MPQRIGFKVNVAAGGWSTRALPSRHFSDFVDELHIVRDGNRSQDADDEQHDEEFCKSKTMRIIR
jgi:hypothetical protein